MHCFCFIIRMMFLHYNNEIGERSEIGLIIVKLVSTAKENVQ